MHLSPTTAERLARGRELFNSGLYFEAHEAWEDAWRVETGLVRLTLHGLIQIAAGLHKGTRQKQPGGCVRLLEKGLEKLRDVPDDACGLALGEFRRAVEEARARALLWQAGERPGLDGLSSVRLEPSDGRAGRG
jgi:predicted metal-dependent hydrolase